MRLDLANFDTLAKTENDHGWVYHEVNLALITIKVSMNRLELSLRLRKASDQSEIQEDTNKSVRVSTTIA